MNTRIQVEHPVTELVSGVDLVAEQILVAGGQPLSFGPADVEPHGAPSRCGSTPRTPPTGASCQCRDRFAASNCPPVTTCASTPGTAPATTIPPEYDNLIAKVVVWGADREEARRRALDALRGLVVDGVPTTAAVAAAVLAHDDFRTVSHSTSWLADQRPMRCRSPATCRCSAAGTGSRASTTRLVAPGPTARRPTTSSSGGGPPRTRSAIDQ